MEDSPSIKKRYLGCSRCVDSVVSFSPSDVCHSLDGIRGFVAAQRLKSMSDLERVSVPLQSNTELEAIRAVARDHPDSPIPDDRPILCSALPGGGVTESRTVHSDIEGHTRHAELAVISYVEAFGCTDLALKLKVLDLRTRAKELDRLSRVEGVSPDVVQALKGLVPDARAHVIDYIKQDRCKDTELKIMVLDLETRVIEEEMILEADYRS